MIWRPPQIYAFSDLKDKVIADKPQLQNHQSHSPPVDCQRELRRGDFENGARNNMRR